LVMNGPPAHNPEEPPNRGIVPQKPWCRISLSAHVLTH
jgi:hypothetical protein